MYRKNVLYRGTAPVVCAYKPSLTITIITTALSETIFFVQYEYISIYQYHLYIFYIGGLLIARSAYGDCGM
jgi:hypothetical protein